MGTADCLQSKGSLFPSATVFCNTDELLKSYCSVFDTHVPVLALVANMHRACSNLLVFLSVTAFTLATVGGSGLTEEDVSCPRQCWWNPQPFEKKKRLSPDCFVGEYNREQETPQLLVMSGKQSSVYKAPADLWNICCKYSTTHWKHHWISGGYGWGHMHCVMLYSA